MRVLSQFACVAGTGWKHEPSQRHIELLARALSLEDAKPSANLGNKAPCDAVEHGQGHQEDFGQPVAATRLNNMLSTTVDATDAVQVDDRTAGHHTVSNMTARLGKVFSHEHVVRGWM